MNEKLTPEVFRQALAAKAKIEQSLEKATDKQLYSAACILARIRLNQGERVPYALHEQDLVALTTKLEPNMKREAVLEYLLNS